MVSRGVSLGKSNFVKAWVTKRSYRISSSSRKKLTSRVLASSAGSEDRVLAYQHGAGPDFAVARAYQLGKAEIRAWA